MVVLVQSVVCMVHTRVGVCQPLLVQLVVVEVVVGYPRLPVRFRPLFKLLLRNRIWGDVQLREVELLLDRYLGLRHLARGEVPRASHLKLLHVFDLLGRFTGVK